MHWLDIQNFEAGRVGWVDVTVQKWHIEWEFDTISNLESSIFNQVSHISQRVYADSISTSYNIHDVLCCMYDVAYNITCGISDQPEYF